MHITANAIKTKSNRNNNKRRRRHFFKAHRKIRVGDDRNAVHDNGLG